MNAVLSIMCDELSDEVIQKLTFDITKTLNAETDLTAEIAEHSGKYGQKGDAITLGHIALTALTSGTVVALLKVFQTMIGQRASLKFNLKKNSGDTVTVDAKNLSPAQYDQTLKMVTGFVGE
jgi:hypothetical protein